MAEPEIGLIWLLNSDDQVHGREVVALTAATAFNRWLVAWVRHNRKKMARKPSQNLPEIDETVPEMGI